MERTVPRAQLVTGLIAGLVGGILIDLFLFGAQIASGRPPGPVVAGTYAWIASALGPVVGTNPAAPLIGLVLHFCVAIGWALGYVYLTRSQPQLLARPWISGAGFGIVVYVLMQIGMLAAGIYRGTSPGDIGISLVAHILFYGIPVALVVSHLRSGAPARA